MKKAFPKEAVPTALRSLFKDFGTQPYPLGDGLSRDSALGVSRRGQHHWWICIPYLYSDVLQPILSWDTAAAALNSSVFPGSTRRKIFIRNLKNRWMTLPFAWDIFGSVLIFGSGLRAVYNFLSDRVIVRREVQRLWRRRKDSNRVHCGLYLCLVFQYITWRHSRRLSAVWINIGSVYYRSIGRCAQL